MPGREKTSESRFSMEKLPDAIIEFLDKNRAATICYTDEQSKPQSFVCLFAFVKGEATLIFKSSYGTEHEDMATLMTQVAGTVLPDKLDLLKIKGVQFKGHTVSESQLSQSLVSTYYNKYPFVRVKSGYLWAIRLESVKFTDNTLVFGHKTYWHA